MVGVEVILAIVALGFVAYDHLSPPAIRGYKALHQWLAKDRPTLIEPNQGYAHIPVQALIEFSDLPFITFQKQSLDLDLRTLGHEILRLFFNLNDYDPPTAHGLRRDQLQLLPKDIYLGESGVLHISWEFLNKRIIEILKKVQLPNKQTDGCKPTVKTAATGGLGRQEMRLQSNGDLLTNNRVHYPPLPEPRDEEAQHLRTSPESKFVNGNSKQKPIISATNSYGPKLPVSKNKNSRVAGGGCRDEEEAAGAAARYRRAITNYGERGLDMDLTKEGHNDKVLEVERNYKKDGVVVLRYKGNSKTKSGQGAMRGKSTIQIMENWKKQEAAGACVYYEIEVKVEEGEGKGIGMGVVGQGWFKKDEMPGCYKMREASVGYDSDVGEVRSGKQPIPDWWGWSRKSWKVSVGDRLGMVLDAHQGKLSFTLNGEVMGEALDLRKAGIGLYGAGLIPVLALRPPTSCTATSLLLRIHKFGWAPPIKCIPL